MVEKIQNFKICSKEGANMYYKNPASYNEIKNFESASGIHLPAAYRAWLEFSDGGELYLPGGVQLYGVAHKPLIDVNCNDRPGENYIVIGALASGDPILFRKDSEEIAIYNQDAGRIEADEVFEDFYDFLSRLGTMLGIEG